jgi:hypothetical protein
MAECDNEGSAPTLQRDKSTDVSFSSTPAMKGNVKK